MFHLSRARSLFSLLGITVVAVVFAFVVAHEPALAQADNLDAVQSTSGFGEATLTDIIGSVISVVLGFLGVIFLLLLIYSGFMWMTAGGDEEKVKKAKRTLINATIGIILTVSSYAIASFVLGALGDASRSGSNGTNGSITPDVLSGSLGGGSIRDHYPERNASDIARNTRIMVTFKNPMDLSSFIVGYDADPTATAINTDNVLIYPTGDEAAALTNVSVSFTEDLQTIVFDPADYLGSSTTDTSYTVSLGTNISYADGVDAFTGSYAGGYEWSFEVGTTIDLTSPTVRSVIPVAGLSYDRNIVIEITFSEAIDPTSATGTRAVGSGFQNIQTTAASDATTFLAGTYEISNAYRTITFTSDDACGTNSCGETIYCLPGNDTIGVTALAATALVDPPQADAFPYDGVTDTSANSLDGDGDGTVSDYAWSFSTTDDINLIGATIESIAPNILEEGVALDQDITVTFDDIMMTSTLTSDNISMENEEMSTLLPHEMWYSIRSDSLTSTGAEVVTATQIPAKTRANIGHGVFLESTGGLTYLYSVVVGEGVENQYQNCYSPAEGPTEDLSACAVDSTSPSCCNGVAGSASCDFFTP